MSGIELTIPFLTPFTIHTQRQFIGKHMDSQEIIKACEAFNFKILAVITGEAFQRDDQQIID
ncbi:MAG: hypothetical protein Q8N35_11160 [Methylococcaceae bacterium]|nr:hypothetical protein [Methylococcaceae bacterium]MDP2394346.1 hypothetical protein [Methylococcaceae bacterium]MDP3020135.1 hypothetical protein [Methylococcaceae bacterium]MDP3391209.1 hypothetical protein [Methylococcaceae bacterium]MDP3932579.1 hypothetical protein [Methylococcaceae bacterium]